MNGFAHAGLNEADFGEKKGPSLMTFDAFPKTKPSYVTRTSGGGIWTLALLIVGTLLVSSEISRWWVGETAHAYTVEKGVGHQLQINLDVVVMMQCHDLHINIQDASGDRILAGDMLKKHQTTWNQWGKGSELHRLESGVGGLGYLEEDVHDYLGAKSGRRKFAKTPRLRGQSDSCRIYGSLEGNKVQGDFHITARGHGYEGLGHHLDHSLFNFSHKINELSFGPFYPSLTNPLDNTIATTDANFFRFQYYVSVVPTVYAHGSNTLATNQYAVTSQSHQVPNHQIPGVFVKFDIEPIVLTVEEESVGFFTLLISLVNVASGVLVAGGWCYQLNDWASELLGRRRRGGGLGVLHGRSESTGEKKDWM